MNKKLLNTCIKNIKYTDGPEIIKFYKEHGFNTRGLEGTNCHNDGNNYVYYGVDNKGFFDHRCLREITNIGAKILTLEEANALVSEKQFPRVMLVARNNNITTSCKRVIFMKKNDKYIAWNNAETLEEAENVTYATTWNYAWEVEELKPSRFPFKLSSKDAKEIIDIACDNWKPLLAEKFAINIVLNQNSIIEEEFYQKMRKACTDTQNLKFDEIFGKD